MKRPPLASFALILAAACCFHASAQTITSFSPSSVAAGSPTFDLTINGQFGGSDFPPTVTWSNLGSATLNVVSFSAVQIVVTVPANLIANPGTAAITVNQPFFNAPVTANFVVAPPQITSLSPTSVTAGSPAFQLLVNGLNFVSGTCATPPCPPLSTVNWNGTALATAQVSATQLSATVPANLILSPGTELITIFGPGTVSSNAVNFVVTYPVPTITSISPSSANSGGPAFTLTVAGTGFFSASVVQWNGASLPTSLVGNFLTAAVPAALISQPGTASVTVLNPGQPSSNFALFTIVAPPILPVISAISPSTTVEGSPAFTLTVNGSGFAALTSVLWNGQPLATAFVSSAQLTAAVPASLVAKAATAVVQAGNPNQAPSNGISFIITPTPIAITSLSPSTAQAGGASFTMTVTGSGFLPGVGALWNGSPLSSTYVSATQLTATVPAALIANTGTATIRAANPNGPQSNGLPFTIVLSTLTLTSLSPNTIAAGGPALSLGITGTGFQSGAQVLWNGSPLATTYGSGTQLTAVVPANLTAAAGNASVSVANPDAVSNSLTFTITAPVFSLTTISPNSAAAGDPAVTITATGTGFTSGSVVQFNGSALPTTFVSATQLTATIPANLLATAGTATVTVVNPNAPPSNALTFTIRPRSVPLTITSLSPNSATAGSATLTLTVNGTGFANDAAVLWNSTSLVTTFVSASQLTVAVPANLLAQPGSASVSVASGGATSNTTNFTVALPPAPSITLTGPATIGPAQQPPITFTLGSAYPLPLTGTVTLTFTPDALVPGDDPAIQFASGGRSLSFNVAANSLTLPALLVQTGTVAGTVTLTLKLTAVGVDVTPPGGTLALQIPRQAPVIRSAQLIRSASGLEIDITGYATSRDVTQATFHFTTAADSNLQLADFTVPLSSTFAAWYASAAAAPYGSQFTYAQPFSIQGNSSAITSVTVTLTNSIGASPPATSN
ncbi:MAG: cell surface receptor domain protein [Bryobacterales bacterium]|nr:cell surface receptor domain protein [Bryobacterales bacterium]